MKKIFLSLCALASVFSLQAQKAQVWDFGAEQLDTEKYENMLSEAEIVSWFPGASLTDQLGEFTKIVASDGVNLQVLNDKNQAKLRFYTRNTNLPAYDHKDYAKDAGGNGYSAIYSNSTNAPHIYLKQDFSEGDKVEYYVSSNGKVVNYMLESPDGTKQTENYDNNPSKQVKVLTYYITQTGTHKFYASDDKMVICRIVRTPVQKATLTGTITAPTDIPAGYTLLFTNQSTGGTTEVTPAAGTYSTTDLALGYEYTVSLNNANGYVVKSPESFTFNTDNQTQDIEIEAVALVTLTGELTGLSDELLGKVGLVFGKPEDKIYEPAFTLNGKTYSLVLEKGVEYEVSATGVNDYTVSPATISATADGTQDFVFTLKPVYKITLDIRVDGVSDYTTAIKDLTATFTNLQETGYQYTFTDISSIALRDGVYSIKMGFTPLTSADISQKLTSNLRVEGKDVDKVIEFYNNGDEPVAYDYRPTLEVGAGKEFGTINAALQYIKQMNRDDATENVTLLIEPGNYEEMLRISLNNITLKNAAAEPSIKVKNGGVDIEDNAVRITSYYGHGYNYYSMTTDYTWDERTLQVNKENGYASVVNTGGSSTTYWNSTVVVYGKNFTAEGIIFENSYNQYVSKKESEDVVVDNGGGKGVRPTTAGNTSVQDRSFRERACALAFAKGSDRGFLKNCRIIGRQDALYGDNNVRVAIDGGILNGACDYIFGGMTLAVKGAELAMLVTSHKDDVAYITASKTDSGKRGYLFWQCEVTSAEPEVDMVENQTAKAGLWGRPWDKNAETVFYETKVGKDGSNSLIQAAGWNDGLTSGGSLRSYEYGTVEEAEVDNSQKRVSWATVLTSPTLPDGTELTLQNFTKGTDGWDPFAEPTAVDNLELPVVKATKILVDGEIRILKDGHQYNVLGAEIK